ncbi:hypothetical protein QYF50_18360 [Paenibacillus vini]|uniref:hypothetical protein n=1 Tax=Paenibacillus vini TaxID=1476024 RepID=UPI0025B69CFA|nr:hypothetical protein [Paenibacillus vini]MDN4069870.1 hypothetical protein [Paenibacillus vini]
MAKTLRKGMLYGILLVAGVTLGMQLSDSGAGQSGLAQNGAWPTNAWSNGSPYNGVQVGSAGAYNGTPAGQAGNQNMVPGYANGNANAGGYGTGYNNGYSNDYNNGNNYGNPNNGQYTADGRQYVDGANGGAALTPGDLLLPQPAPPAVDRFADKTANLLQQVSRKGIHWFASWFGPSME